MSGVGRTKFVTLIQRFNLTADEIQTQLKKHEIIPDVIPTAPKNVLQVTYNTTSVRFGNEINATETKLEPTHMEWPEDKEHHYTLIMTDPDVPNRTTHFEREWQNWVVVNIPGCKFKNGKVLTKYIPPLPEEDFGGVHRYVFLSYKQPRQNMTFNETYVRIASYGLRGEFSTRKFAEKYSLGDPVAVNFFYLRWSFIV
ncbi:protein D1 isoform X2 [Bemisia tabaci]|uniref:protein D1 isoform X2 n=2 Tax=Bemisia tabaci TaxID=7038 RepID=UPI003B2881D9